MTVFGIDLTDWFLFNNFISIGEVAPRWDVYIMQYISSREDVWVCKSKVRVILNQINGKLEIKNFLISKEKIFSLDTVAMVNQSGLLRLLYIELAKVL